MGYPDKLVGTARKVTSAIYTYSCCFTRFDKLQIGARMTIIKSASSDSFVIYSTIPYDSDVIKSVDDLMIQNGDLPSGESFVNKVTHIIIPDVEHTLAVKGYKSKHPSIKIIGMEGCNPEIDSIIDYKFTLAKQNVIYNKENLVSDLKLSPETDSTILNEFQFLYFPAHKNQELVAYHSPDKTLIEGDLFFNFQFHGKSEHCDLVNEQFGTVDPTKGVYGWLTKKLFVKGTWLSSKLASKIIADPVLGAKGLKAITNSWEFEKIIPCHGDVVERNGNEFFNKFFKL